MGINRNKFSYVMFSCITMVVGLVSRKLYNLLPYWMNMYLGDALWALMVFFLIGAILNKESTTNVMLVTWVFCIIIELSQLYQAQWINEIRNTLLGGLVLGYGFLWNDIIAYSIGTILGVKIEKLILNDNVK